MWINNNPNKKFNCKKDYYNADIKEIGSTLVLGGDCHWSSEWDFFRVEEVPDLETIQKLMSVLEEAEAFRYWEQKIILGTKWSLEE